MLSHNGEIHGIDLLNSRLDRDWSKTFLERVFAVSKDRPVKFEHRARTNPKLS